MHIDQQEFVDIGIANAGIALAASETTDIFIAAAHIAKSHPRLKGPEAIEAFARVIATLYTKQVQRE